MGAIVLHSKFEETIEGWRPFSTNNTVERSTEQAFEGIASLKSVPTVASRGPMSPAFDASAFEVIKISVRVFPMATSNITLYVAKYPGNNAVSFTVSDTFPANQWTEIAMYAPGISDQLVWLRNGSGAINFYIDDVIIEEYSAPPPAPPPPGPHTLANVQAGLSAALATIPDLRIYDFPSSRVEPPAVVLSLPDTPYDVTLGGRSDEWTFPLWLLVSKADDRSSYNEMTPYLEAEGPRSILAAIEADRTLGGSCDTAAVIKASPQFATVAGTDFLAVEFTLEVYT